MQESEDSSMAYEKLASVLQETDALWLTGTRPAISLAQPAGSFGPTTVEGTQLESWHLRLHAAQAAVCRIFFHYRLKT